MSEWEVFKRGTWGQGSPGNNPQPTALFVLEQTCYCLHSDPMQTEYTVSQFDQLKGTQNKHTF